MMIRLRWTTAGFALGFVAALGAGLGRGERGPAQEIGETLDRASHAALRWLNGTIGAVGGHLGRGLAAQVSDRLGRDKNLDVSGVTVESDGDGRIVLRGLMDDADSKERAVELARDTRGVRQVTDQLAVRPRPRVVAAPAEDGTPDESSPPPPEQARVIRARQPRIVR